MVDILAFGAHPDDIEFGCGGILAKMAAKNMSIVMVDLTMGQMGTSGYPEIRQKESNDAAKLINAQRVQLDFMDCQVIDSFENRLKLVDVVRRYKPKLVLAPMWEGVQNHPDHTACGLMARYACRYARFNKILPTLPIHWVDGILHYLPLVHTQPDFIFDVTHHVETWTKMMAAHVSQHLTFDYTNWNLRKAAELGMIIDRPYAQGLLKGNPLIIEDLQAISKGIREI